MNLLIGELFVGNHTKIDLDKMLKKIIYEYSKNNSCVSPTARHVMRRIIARNQYEEHEKHFLETTQIELFNKFKEENREIDVLISALCHKNRGM